MPGPPVRFLPVAEPAKNGMFAGQTRPGTLLHHVPGKFFASVENQTPAPPLLRPPISSSADLVKERLLGEENDCAEEQRLQALHPAARVVFVAAKLEAAAQQNADTAVNEAIRFCDQDPSYSLEYGRALLSTLSVHGDYRAALRFVLAEEAEGWLGENGSKWLTTLFSTWAREAPQQALQSVEGLVPAGQRAEALQTVAAIWAQSDPTALVDFLHRLPASPEREQLLQTTLSVWSDEKG